MKYYIIAGEASGDLHASNLMKALTEKDQDAEFRVWGGDAMEAAGGNVVKHYRDLAFMGFVEVVLNLRTILGNIRFCKKDIENYQPDVLVLVDYPGFNLRIAKWAKQKGFRVFYYISPQIWAWNSSRVHKIKKTVDHMFVILPFEQAFYQKYEYKVDFIGHPLLDVVEHYEANNEWKNHHNIPQDKSIIALLPGSRKQEIKALLPTMLNMVERFPSYHFVIAGAPAQKEAFYQNIINLQKNSNVSLVFGHTYDILYSAKAALVASGTATLETALFNIPQVVCYKGNPLSYQIAKRLVNVDYISLVNLIMDEQIVSELIQDEFTNSNLEEALQTILDSAQQEGIQKKYAQLNQRLGTAGASKRAANLMYHYLQQKALSQ